jgi:hypothetical protein
MLHKAFAVVYGLIALLFVVAAGALITFAGLELWRGINPGAEVAITERFDAVLESIALLTIAVAALELGQTIVEEEIQRQVHTSAPTRVRRFLSRFLIVVVVALAIECLVAVFQFSHSDPALLPQAALIGVAAGVLLAAWGVFVRLNRSAEEIEPEAMEDVKEEDQQVR